MELSLVLHCPDVAPYGQLLGQLLIFSCQPFDDLLQWQLELPAVVRKGLQPYPANTANDTWSKLRHNTPEITTPKTMGLLLMVQCTNVYKCLWMRRSVSGASKTNTYQHKPNWTTMAMRGSRTGSIYPTWPPPFIMFRSQAKLFLSFVKRGVMQIEGRNAGQTHHVMQQESTSRLIALH